ncbi:hypothetical protein LTR05_000581 [Lithohypha guttulata]|uniref:Major facilitator superfamily (MFS) profile domain-containing protein n=1 Tax=Lithohypha guttulata TaxID=1690604 RepID=A0AAN7T699_9EURO|nr:hypothetical protein LTR05_000581 [Lithohypha guttulata]
MATYLQYRHLRQQLAKQLEEKVEDARDLPSLSQQKTRVVGGRPVLVVDWDAPDDTQNPRNWPFKQKLCPLLMVSLLALLVGACAPIDSPIIPDAAAEFHVSTLVESLSVGNFLTGFGFGALVAGPVSEVLGRSRTYLTTLGVMCIFLMASALAPNIGAQLVFRFLAGFAGSAPLVCAGGTISDLFNPLEKTYIFPIFAMQGFTGPVLGSVMSAWVPDSPHLHTWRWSEWIALMFSGTVFFCLLAFQPETYEPVLLSWKAKHLRRLTGDDRYVALHEVERIPLVRQLQTALMRPFVMAWYEPVIQLSTLYLSVVYIVLFTFFGGYEEIFKQTYNLSTGMTYTLFLAIAIGVLSASAIIPIVYRITCKAANKAAEEGKSSFDPEIRLWYAMIGAPFVPISLFWMAWTCYPSISIWSGIIASVFFGFGIICVFFSNYMYLIDTYTQFAASGLTFNTLVRYSISRGMTVVGIPFYQNLGPHWTLTIMACVSVLLTPLPYLFYRYGHVIRSRSRYATYVTDSNSKTRTSGQEKEDPGLRERGTLDRDNSRSEDEPEIPGVL